MKRAFTLIELLVYMAILGFIIIVAGRAFSDSTSMRVRSQNMLKSAEQVGQISQNIKEDLSQMGAKAWGQSSASNSYIVSVDNSVYMSATSSAPNQPNCEVEDCSSFALTHGANGEGFDSIAFRKMAFDESGEFLGVREISWAARNDKTLHRRCRTVSPASCASADAECETGGACPRDATNMSSAPAILMASNVRKFVLTPSQPGMALSAACVPPACSSSDTLFPILSNPPLAQEYGFKLLARAEDGDIKSLSAEGAGSNTTRVTVSGFSRNTNSDSKFHSEVYFSAGETETNWANCKQFSFKKGETYAVEFDMPFAALTAASTKGDSNSTQFLPGIDHIALGFRTNVGTVISGAPNDVLFYPAQDPAAAAIPRHAEFSFNKDATTACLAFTFAFYSPKAGSSNLKFSNFKIYRKSDEAFHFAKEGDSDYENGYGAETNLDGSERTSAATAAEQLKQKREAKAFELLLEIDNRGEVAGTYSKDENGTVILTPNNGVVAKPSATP